MQFSISTLNGNGSGIMFNKKADFIQRISDLIDICAINGGNYFDADIDSDASCISINAERWEKANKFLDDMIAKAEDRSFRLYGSIVPLKIRYMNGERSVNLYEDIMRFK